jgi:hypothetical protein
MSLTMYDASVPVFIRALGILSTLLDKAVAHAEVNGIDPARFVEARLIADMNPLRSQIQSASDTSKGAAARLSGAENPSFPDTETTMAELQERIAKTIAFLESVDARAFEGSETRDVVLKTRREEVHFKGQDYLLTFALPNFFFHVTTAFDILRAQGVQIGKKDYLGRA